jgi:hypothetical protein
VPADETGLVQQDGLIAKIRYLSLVVRFLVHKDY